MKEKITDLVTECGERSSFHGFPSLASGKVPRFIKIIWILCCLGSWSYFVYQIVNTVNNYNQYSVVSSVSVGYEAPSTFPAIDICNLNPFDGKKLIGTAAAEDILNAKSISDDKYDSYRQYTDSASGQLKETYEYLNLNNSVNVVSLGFYLYDVLLSCEYQGKVCTTSDFYLYHNYNYGNCYRFNGVDSNQVLGKHNYTSTTVRKSSKSGWRNGLRLELYTGDQGNQQKYSYKVGYRVIVHNQSNVPFPDEDGIDVSAGLQTNVAVSRTFVYRLSAPYSQCVDQLDANAASQNDMLKILYDQKQAGKITQYQQKYCLKVCYQSYIISSCSCGLLSLFYLDFVSVRACQTNTDMTCVSLAESTYSSGDQMTTCYTKCPNECNVINYDLKVSTADYPPKWYAEQFSTYQNYFGINRIYNYTDEYDSSATPYSGPTLDLIKRTTVMLNVFYESMTFSKIEESPSLTFDV